MLKTIKEEQMLNKNVEYPKYPELGIGRVVEENGVDKVTVLFDKGHQSVLPISDLVIVPSRKQIFIYRGDEKFTLGEVKQDQIDFVLEKAVVWITVEDLVTEVTKRFSEYRTEDGKHLNQGGFDPMFVITQRNPGFLIKTGKLIFKKAPPKSGSHHVFKSRVASSQSEIEQCEQYARNRGKFVYGDKSDADNNQSGVQETHPSATV